MLDLFGDVAVDVLPAPHDDVEMLGLAQDQEALGPDHPETLQAMANLGVALEGRGKVDDALRAFAEAYQGVSPSELPPSRKAGVKVKTVSELVEKLKSEAKVL